MQLEQHTEEKNKITYCDKCKLLFNSTGKIDGSVDGYKFEWHDPCKRIVLYNHPKSNNEFREALAELLWDCGFNFDIGVLIASFIR